MEHIYACYVPFMDYPETYSPLVGQDLLDDYYNGTDVYTRYWLSYVVYP
jgi:hypothetical protein